MPPEAVRVWEYGDATVPPGRLPVVMLIAGGLTAMLSGAVVVAPEVSRTLTVKLLVPAEVGVPLITPAALSESPAGKESALIDHA